MSYLTKAVRENMHKVVLDHTFKEKQDAAKAELVAAGDALYMAHHGEYLESMQKIPSSFFVNQQIMKSNIGGQYHDVALSQRMKMCYKGYHARVVFEANDPAAIAWLQAIDKVNDFKNQRNTMSNKVNAILESVRTFKKLWEVWPEAKPLLEHFEEKPPVAYLPAIQFDQLNSELGLPPAFPWSHRLTGTGAYEIGHFGPSGFVKNQEVDTIEKAKEIVDAHNAKLGM